MLIWCHHGVGKLFEVKSNFPPAEEGGSNGSSVRAVRAFARQRKSHVLRAFDEDVVELSYTSRRHLASVLGVSTPTR